MVSLERASARVGNATVKLHLTTTKDNRLIRTLRRYARQSRGADACLVGDPARADAIVFVETVDWRDPHFLRVHRHRLTREHPDRVVLFNEGDVSRARLPAVAMNATRAPWQIGLGSLPIHEDQPPIEPIATEPTELMSFVGSRTSPVRHRILDRYASVQPAVIDTDAYDAWHTTRAERSAQRRAFEHALAAGLFALCPRGGGSGGSGRSSLRLYEAMQAGRCPVILSDRWVEDHGVDWSFALRVAEADCERLEELLGAVSRDEALARGAEGRRRWEAAYAPERYLDTLGSAVRTLLERGARVPRRRLVDVLRDARYATLLRARQLQTHWGTLGGVAPEPVAMDGDTAAKP